MLNDIFPLVLERRPSAVLEIVGQGAERIIARNANRNVHYVGMVDDLKPYLGRCALMVLPLRFGGGVRMRMMEAAALAVPVVSTPAGVAGMGLVKGREYVEGLDADGMAEAVVNMLDDREAAETIGRNARSWAEREISLDSYPDRLEPLLEELASRRSNRRM
jgi:glycosyltransferase involved in cell wall biosynthesis